MSQETTFTIKKAYQLSAINKAGKRVYFDIDQHSGGYPYWSTWHNNLTFDSLDKIPTLKNDSYMYTDIMCIEVLEVTIAARVVESTEMVSEAKAKAMAEIAKIEAELAKKIAMLGAMK